MGENDPKILTEGIPPPTLRIGKQLSRFHRRYIYKTVVQKPIHTPPNSNLTPLVHKFWMEGLTYKRIFIQNIPYD